MIRRDAIGPDGRACWILISQIEHARLAGSLAAPWGRPPFAPLVPRDEVLAAVTHHDDGWRDWEQRIHLDPAHARPRDFMEMPLEDSLAIWSGSIESAAAIGPLAGYMVAGHFLHLLKASKAWEEAEGANNQNSNDSTPAATHDAAHRWAQAQEAQQARWLGQWLAAGDRVSENVNRVKERHGASRRLRAGDRAPEIALQAVALLRFFDAVSLWFCCRNRTDPYNLDPPGGPTLTLAPGREDRVGCSPWPFLVPRLELQVQGQSIPARPYRSDAELAAADRQPLTLRWTLVESET